EYVKENFEEGLEEVIQDLIEKGTDALAAELGNYEITGLDAKTIAHDAWENFRGGLMGSLVLGLPTSAIKVNADVKEFTKVRQLSEVVESQEMFNALTDESPIFRDMTTQEKREAQKTSWENGQARKEARATEDAKQIAEGLDAGEGAEERKVTYDENGNEIEEETAESVARDEKGRLFVQDQEYKDDDGKVTGGQFWAGNAEQSGKEAGNRYGYITYSQDENGDITIDTFKMTKGREGLREEMFDQFAQEHPDVKIEWNAIGSDTQAIKQSLIDANPSGAKNGLSRYTTESLNDPNNAARKRAMAEIGNVIHNIEEVRDTNGNLVRDENGRVKVKRTQLTQQQLAAAVSFVELGAKTISGLSLEEYMNKSYENGRFFGSTQDFINKTLAQGERVDNKNGGIRQGTAQQGWQKDGMIIKNVIYAAENADFATFVHEVAHGFRAQLSGQMLADAEAAFGVKDGNWDGLSKYKYADGSYMTYEEAFAYYAQDYFITGKAPTPQMENIFKRLAQFLAEAYSRLRKHLDISPEISKVFNELLADDDSVYNKALKAAREQENEYRANLKRQAEEAKATKEAEEQEAQKQAELEKEEAGEYTDYEQETTQQSAEEIEEQLEESNEEETGNAIDNALGNLELTDETKNQVAETLKDPTTTTPEKANAIVDAAGEQFDLFQRQEGLLYQLAGEPSIRRMAESEEKRRILADLDAAVNLEKIYKDFSAETRALRIRRATGWERDANGQWKYELDDSVNRIKGGAVLNGLMRTSPELLSQASKKAMLNLGDIYDAPELYKVFPYMKNV
ncbi:MAG: hypothetical protein J6P07_00720, partial [Spirochaetaceae bacterium]|nr:hypothetical protein [Spirochaetaceae bacterium]